MITNLIVIAFMLHQHEVYCLVWFCGNRDNFGYNFPEVIESKQEVIFHGESKLIDSFQDSAFWSRIIWWIVARPPWGKIYCLVLSSFTLSVGALFFSPPLPRNSRKNLQKRKKKKKHTFDQINLISTDRTEDRMFLLCRLEAHMTFCFPGTKDSFSNGVLGN